MAMSRRACLCLGTGHLLSETILAQAGHLQEASGHLQV